VVKESGACCVLGRARDEVRESLVIANRSRALDLLQRHGDEKLELYHRSHVHDGNLKEVSVSRYDTVILAHFVRVITGAGEKYTLRI
jgi:hypothetical protein